MKIQIRDKEFTFLKGYQNDNKYRNAFNQLAEKTFPISFETWYRDGYWNEKYTPYTLFNDDKAIANVSASIMDFNAFDEHKRYIQLGTVMTDENYRNKGLSRFLLEKVVEDWNDKCDFVYLYANSSVLDFYPKLGFTPVKEYEYLKSITNLGTSDFVKINMDDQENRDKLYDYITKMVIISKLAMQENADLVMFYCITNLKDCVYYSKSLDTFVIAKFNNNQLHLLDVYSKVEVALNDVISSLCTSKIETVLLGFTPRDCASYQVRLVDEVAKDEVLFIQNGKTELFIRNKLMFPLLSHA